MSRSVRRKNPRSANHAAHCSVGLVLMWVGSSWSPGLEEKRIRSVMAVMVVDRDLRVGRGDVLEHLDAGDEVVAALDRLGRRGDPSRSRTSSWALATACSEMSMPRPSTPCTVNAWTSRPRAQPDVEDGARG